MANGLLLRLPFSGDKMIGEKMIGEDNRLQRRPDRGDQRRKMLDSGPWSRRELRPAEAAAAVAASGDGEFGPGGGAARRRGREGDASAREGD
ncbi:hypothetical protein NL676_036025 [Syzygium grande]|nr:hypothetical protein NL676_036025 [Syzygium grande]